ncbi:sirohydrochlorin chelatase [Peribacillus cavernae]|uniref:Sirohydrochlorin chelatase n=1 Tax=Peribacillus cavernae TaxID=1674310 RepID=A0A433HKF9_9BACI|nr:sirohydrochlorin chelatase [Peribacillus cavernae]MDQ0219114.1 sirohydrochlorin ferrochelatase [Peribacillus cavernae]RUQ28653.1 sirohydrochlorin chelatase [Peribacillus cavernae]
MEAILYICHGSRVCEACEQAISFIKNCMLQSDVLIQEYCFLELADPTIEAAYERCVRRGATRINVIPVLLLTAAHAKEDIPNELERIGKQYPEVEMVYGRPIGVHHHMIDILMERLDETSEELSEDSMVLLIGRGSSDPDVKRDLSRIAQLLKEKAGLNRVDTCYLTAAEPGLEEALQTAKQSSYKKIFIIPYLLFTGILMKTIQKTVKDYSSDGDKEYILSNYLGYHPLIGNILQERVIELSGGVDRVSDHA